MAITSEQRKALEAAGYKISENGKTVLTSEGKSVGGYNENGNIWSGSSKVRDILKSKPAPKSESKPAPKPRSEAKAADTKPATRPKANPARKPGGARPEGPASGMPAKRENRRQKDDRSAGMPILAAGAAVAGAGRKPATGRPVNPSYTGRAVMPEGFQGRMNTDVARPRAAGGVRAIGANPVRRGLRAPGGGGRVVKMPDVLELAQMNKGGMVKKPARTYKK